MTTLIIIGVIGSIIAIKVAIKKYDDKTMPKILFQKAKDYTELINKAFYKNFIPMIYDMKALAFAYANLMPRLNEVEACKFFSYPKEYIIDDKDNLIVNGVNLGDAKKNELIVEHYSDTCTGYGIRYGLIKKQFGGRLVIDEYKGVNSFSEFLNKPLMQRTIKNNYYNKQNEVLNNLYDEAIDKIEVSSKNAFRRFKNVLPEKYVKLYEEFMANDYSVDEMKNKLNALYKESNDEYEKIAIKRNINIESSRNKQQEKINEFFGGYTADYTRIAKNEKDFEKVDKTFYSTGMMDQALVDKYDESKEIIEEYGLE